MNCQDVREQLALYLYEEVTGEVRAGLEAHLKGCAACARALAEEEQLHRLLRERPLREPSPELLVECRAGLSENLAEEALGWRGLLRNWFGDVPVPAGSRALAGLALLVTGFGAGWAMRPQAQPVSSAPTSARAGLVSTDLSGMRISGIRQVSADPETGRVQLAFDAEQRLAMEGTLDDPRIQRLLIYTVKNYENPGIRLDTLDALRATPSDPEVRDALVYAMLKDTNAGVRLQALEAVSELTWEAPLRQAVIEVLQRDRNPGVRVSAVNLLARHADEQVVPLLRALARKDRSPYVRLQCARALQKVSAEY